MQRVIKLSGRLNILAMKIKKKCDMDKTCLLGVYKQCFNTREDNFSYILLILLLCITT